MPIDLPLHEVQETCLNNGKYALKFSVPKHNSYIADRTITMEEATKCVLLQNRWATSHEITTLANKKRYSIDVTIETISDLGTQGKLLTASVKSGNDEHQVQFIVTESRSHWFFVDLALLGLTPVTELGSQSKPTAVVASYN